MASAYSTIIAICSESLQGTLENTARFAQLRPASNSLGLLEMIKRVMFTQKEKKHPALARTEARSSFIGLQQGEMPVQKYYDTFVQSMEVMRLCGGNLGITDDAARARLVVENNTNPSGDEILEMMNTMEQEDYASMLLYCADNHRFALLKEELSNNFAMGMDSYPATLAAARTMLANRSDKAVHDMRRRSDRPGESEVMLATDGEEGGRRRRGLENVTCYQCGERGHIATNCPQRQGTTNLTSGAKGENNNANTGEAAGGNATSSGGAVQCLMDGIELSEYDDVACEYADLFVTMEADDDDLNVEDEEPDIGVCHNCDSKGWVGLLCQECKDQGCIFERVADAGDNLVDGTMTILPEEKGHYRGEFGICDGCNNHGPIGKTCYCSKGRFRSMYGRCTYCQQDGPIGKPCISKLFRASYYERVMDKNHGYPDAMVADGSPKIGISWNKKDPSKAVIHTKKGHVLFDARTSKTVHVDPKEGTTKQGFVLLNHHMSEKVVYGEIKDGTTTQGFVLLNHQGKLPDDWILLDNQSTVNVFANRKLLKNIRTTNRIMVIRCNAGVTRTNMIGDLPGYSGEVWFYPDGIANILSYADMAQQNCITYDNEVDDVFHVHLSDGSTYPIFSRSILYPSQAAGKHRYDPAHQDGGREQGAIYRTDADTR
jgi:Zinc knuckle